jgi:hypothetical protein
MARSWGRGVEYHSKVFDKGRRPRRHIKSPQAKAGVRRLRLTLVVVGLTIAFCAWSYRDTSPQRERAEPSTPDIGLMKF